MNEIVLIVDKSGSMGSQVSDTLGSLNSFLADAKLKRPDDLLTLVFFDRQVEVVHECKRVADVHKLTTDDYQIRGSTALNDAIGKTLKTLAASARKADKIMVGILTDGEENASTDFTLTQVKALIEANGDWDIHFMGVGLEKFAEGGAHAFGLSYGAGHSTNTDTQCFVGRGSTFYSASVGD